MKKQTQVALAVGAGYVLGRRHNLRLAAMLGAAAVTGGFGGLTGQLLRRGTKALGASGTLGKVSPELGEVTEMVRGELLDAGKAAALAAVRSRVDRVSDKLHDQAELLRQPRGDDRAAEPGDGPTDGFDDAQDDAAHYEDGDDELADADEDDDAHGYVEDEELDYSEDSYDETEDGEQGSPDAGESAGTSSVSSRAGKRRSPSRPPVQRTRR